jgi:hypothetical protein
VLFGGKFPSRDIEAVLLAGITATCGQVLDLQLLQTGLTIVAVTVDLILVFRLIWLSMLREIPKSSGMSASEAFRWAGRALGAWAKERKELEELSK